jgi:hypothetical protein
LTTTSTDPVLVPVLWLKLPILGSVHWYIVLRYWNTHILVFSSIQCHPRVVSILTATKIQLPQRCLAGKMLVGNANAQL